MNTGHRLALATLILFTASIAGTTAGPGSAHALKLDPGEWEFTTTSHAPMAPEPRVETKSECIVDGNRGADEFLAGMDECEVTDLVDTESTMSYKISCPRGEMSLEGAAVMKTDGKTVNGDMKMSMSMVGREMTMKMNWAGKRKGACKGE